MLLLVQLLHPWHKLQEVLHSDQFAVEFVVALSKPNLEERSDVHEYTEEADEDWMKHSRPEEYAEFVVQDENSK